MNSPRLKQHAIVGAYQIIQYAGGEDGSALYLARRENADALYWLVDSGSQGIGAAQPGAEVVKFKNENYVAFSIEGTSVAAIKKLVGVFDWKFIVPRWLALLDQVGYLHAKNQLLQQGRPLDLNGILFSDQAALMPLSFQQPSVDSVILRAPELASRNPTFSSDVYALGSGLLFLLGGGSPETAFLNQRSAGGVLGSQAQLAGILRKATDFDPLKRYRDVTAFAQALSAVSPRIKSVAAPAQKRSPIKASTVILLLVLVLFAALAVLIFFLPNLLNLTTPSAAAGPTVSPLQQVAGTLDMEITGIDFAPDSKGHIDLKLVKGGQPLPFELPVDFALWLNENPIGQVDVEKKSNGANGETQVGVYRLSFDAASLPTTTGTYRITAKMIGSSVTKTVYYEAAAPASAGSGSLATPQAGKSDATATPSARSVGLANLSISGLQVDARQYPELAAYFTLSGKDGNVARLQGPLTIQVVQDGQLVSDVRMAAIDPSLNPVTTALAFDVSGSMFGGPNAQARAVAALFVNQLGIHDTACIYSFSTVINRLQSCSANRSGSANALNAMPASGNTALYDALISIADDLSKLDGRKAIVLLSDGADTASHSTLQAALAQLKRTNIPVYAIGLHSPQFNRAVMSQIASETNGSFLEAPSAADLGRLYGLINAQLKNQYRITFQSVAPRASSGTLTVRLVQGADQIEQSVDYSPPDKSTAP